MYSYKSISVNDFHKVGGIPEVILKLIGRGWDILTFSPWCSELNSGPFWWTLMRRYLGNKWDISQWGVTNKCWIQFELWHELHKWCLWNKKMSFKVSKLIVCVKIVIFSFAWNHSINYIISLNIRHLVVTLLSPCCHPVPLHSLPYIFFRNRVPWQKLEWVCLRLAIGDNLKPRKKMLQFPLFMFHLWNQPCLINDKVCLTVYTQFVIRSLLEEVPVIQTVKSAFQCHCHITVFIIILLWIFFFLFRFDFS